MTSIHTHLDENIGDDLFANKSTMMANFEEWIRMATDNKINSRNSWNFALIDYFYDLNVLRDNENNINFQRASATLDGCIKIYSSRVDSVSNETGKLLSGLAQRRAHAGKKTAGAEGEGDGGDEEEGSDAEDSVVIDAATGLPVAKNADATHGANRRNYNRTLETTLVEFDQIKMNQLDQELNIDPLFKKALVDFDEGGAKSLLLNTLNIDKNGRVIFDASIKDTENGTGNELDVNDESRQAEDDEADDPLEHSNIPDTSHDLSTASRNLSTLIQSDDKDTTFVAEDEILALGLDYIEFGDIAQCEVSTLLPQLRSAIDDVQMEKTFINSVNVKADNFLTEQDMKDVTTEADAGGLNEDDIPGLPYTGNGDGDESDEGSRQNNSAAGNFDDVGGVDDEEANGLANETGNYTNGEMFEKDLMAYFDQTLNSNWRGREHWKVRNIKKTLLKESDDAGGKTNRVQTASTNNSDTTSETSNDKLNEKKSSNKKQQEILDFFHFDDNLEDTVFEVKKGKNTIELAQKLRINENHYLLPDDYHFSSDKITKLFIKPEQTMSVFNHKRFKRSDRKFDSSNFGNDSSQPTNNSNVPEIADEEFWADNYDMKKQQDKVSAEEGTDIRGMQVENPFDDDEGNGVDFNQAFDDAEYDDIDHPSMENKLPNQQFDEQKPSLSEKKVNYSRVSKKVDVRKLKNNVWKSINKLTAQAQQEDTTQQVDGNKTVIELKFTDVTKQLVNQYSPEILKDISTSFCFICLLHLANEHGLQIKNTENFEDLIIQYQLLSTDNDTAATTTTG
ncbi:condensin subunit BRN1 KNAG_0C04370 [Huiozyma naganishii CBS 8797]|uniref:Condensin complex subunit 2 n=1 Tax=Huiozyma naganishii (strain ATCC MYA-139 / BCRC 22969 / CBS 8797 / KCTC 17520 / NBRC 10181 / NCYC 3082 / Yp74L-3) TaxID=1071383 RepID=J7S4Y3_HUIN7|nr:hypothetical protein KNAG_0C04370 [Kazachstania naganishii CBS 8797]CCK69539.1 hypothetical protein KNAG_0C04370 [Kazachstania naganishii CBS 8797]